MNQSNLKKLQNLLKEKNSDIFVINRSDEYLNEYISPNAERLNFITNFSGSAGRAIITPTNAFLYVDGRYTFQANTQINAKEIHAKHLNSFWTDLEKILLEKELKIDPIFSILLIFINVWISFFRVSGIEDSLIYKECLLFFEIRR